MKNFDFIKELAEVIPAFHQLHAYCDKAEIFQKAFPRRVPPMHARHWNGS